jgi:hypothetical protein
MNAIFALSSAHLEYKESAMRINRWIFITEPCRSWPNSSTKMSNPTGRKFLA